MPSEGSHISKKETLISIWRLGFFCLQVLSVVRNYGQRGGAGNILDKIKSDILNKFKLQTHNRHNVILSKLELKDVFEKRDTSQSENPVERYKKIREIYDSKIKGNKSILR